MWPEHDRGRPGEERPRSVSDDTLSLPPTRAERAELVMRIAWLRVHADVVRGLDPSGLLSAQLLDLADLLEGMDRRSS